MPTISQYALVSAALKAIRDLVDAQDKSLRADATAAYIATYQSDGIKSLDVRWGGEKVATATLSIPKPVPASVGDRAAFTRWVRANAPEFVTEVVTYEVDPAYTSDLLAALEFHNGQAIDPETGELVSGIIPPHTPEPKSYSIKFADGGADTLLTAWRQGALAEVEEALMLTDGEFDIRD